MKVLLHPKTAQFLEKLNKQLSDRIKEKLKELENNPKKGKLMSHSNFWILRIGDYRAIYEISKDMVIILYIGHRKKVYEDFSRLFFIF